MLCGNRKGVTDGNGRGGLYSENNTFKIGGYHCMISFITSSTGCMQSYPLGMKFLLSFNSHMLMYQKYFTKNSNFNEEMTSFQSFTYYM